MTFDDIFVLKAPSPLIPPPPTSVKYYYFGGQRVAMRRTETDSDDSTLSYLHSDHLGSTRLVTDENGDAISSQGYFAFGSERSGGPIPTDHSFTGQKVDRSGLLYYNARYYDPELGVFVSPDTIVPDPENVFAYNRYMYVFGNPLKYIDPSGHCATTDNGGRDLENDVQCWTLVDSILNVYDGYFSNKYGISAEEFEKYAEKDGITHEFLFGELLLYNDYQDTVRSQQIQDLKAYRENNPSPGRDKFHPCRDVWDCPAITLDLASLGTSVAQSGAVACTATGVGAPACGPSAAYLTGLDISINATSVAYETYKYTHDDSTGFDLSVSLADSVVKPAAIAAGAGTSAIPGVGIVYDVLMLGYDVFIDPFYSTPGSAKAAR